MKTIFLRLFLISFGLLFNSCASERSKGVVSDENWSSMEFSDFKVLVEESNKHQSWGYHGTVEGSHYFTRSPGRAFVGKYLNIKVKSDKFPTNFKVIHFNNASQLSFQSYVFTKAISLGGGFDHKIARGWVAEPLMPE